MSKVNKTPDFQAMGRQLLKDMQIIAEKEGVDFFQSSFEKEGFTDVGFEPWAKRNDQLSYKVLQKTAYLKNSIQVFDSNSQRITFGSDAEYAQIHNNGGRVTIPVTNRSRKYFWFMYKVTGNSKWRAMAMTRKQQFTFIMPKRQFIGESKALLNSLDQEISEHITKQFKQL